MTTIAFAGGSSLCELGPHEDVSAFFECLNRFAVHNGPAHAFELLTDRLYRRFLRQEDLEPAREQMKKVLVAFDLIPTEAVDWQMMGVGAVESKLALTAPTLAGVFEKYFDFFDHCVESSRLNFEEFGKFPGYRFEPVRTVIADQPWFLADKQRNLEDYEALQGLPFWLRVR